MFGFLFINVFLKIELVILFSKLFDYKITYIDILPLFNIIGEDSIKEFNINPTLKITTMVGGSIFDSILSNIFNIEIDTPYTNNVSESSKNGIIY